jgi:hypothetical protein
VGEGFVKPTMRVLGVATVTAVSVGLVAATWSVLSSEPRNTVIQSLTTVAALRDLLLLAALVSVPVSLPAGVAGGAVAAFVLARERGTRPLSSWVGRGGFWGLVLGAVGLMLYLTAINFRSDELLPMLVLMAPMGAVPGAIVGCLVGAYCWRTERGVVAGQPSRS